MFHISGSSVVEEPLGSGFSRGVVGIACMGVSASGE